MKEFDDIYNKEITKKYAKHEVKRLSKLNSNRERKLGAIGRHFTRCKKQIFDAFSVLSSVHNLHINRISL